MTDIAHLRITIIPFIAAAAVLATMLNYSIYGFGQWSHSFLVLSNCLGNSLKKASGSIFVYIAPTRSVQNEAKLESAGCICLGSNNTRT